jgi:trimeric autotransporter adhesin
MAGQRWMPGRKGTCAQPGRAALQRLLLAVAVCPVVAGVLLLAQAPSSSPAGQSGSRCTVAGEVTTGRARLPGVVITVTPAAGAPATATSTGLDGRYAAPVEGPGTYTVQADLAAFAPATREVTVDASCQARLDLVLTLASRTPGAAPIAAKPMPVQPVRPGANPVTQFQRVGAMANRAGSSQDAAAGGGLEDAATVAAHLSLPPGFSPDSLSDSVAAFGSTGQTNGALLFGGIRAEGTFGREEIMAMGGVAGIPGMGGDGAALPAGGFPGGLPGGAGGMGGPGGFGGPGVGGGRGGGLEGPGGGRGGFGGEGFGGRGGPGGGPGGRLAFAAQQLNNRPRGQVSYTLAGSPLDAAPYPLTGQPTTKPQYFQQRFAATIGGPLKIPKLFDAGRQTTFFLSYSGNHSSNVYNRYSTVPTLAERTGDFSSIPAPLTDPLTGQAFAGNQIPLGRFSPAALALLKLFPTPNQPGDRQNFYYSTTAATNADDVNFRLIRSFGQTNARRPQGARGAGGGRSGAAGRGGINLNIGVHFTRSNSDQLNSFPSLAGKMSRSGWNIPVGFSFPLWGGSNSLNVSFNRSHSAAVNSFAGAQDVAGEAGITGVSSDPFDWGAPTLSFSSLSGLSDTAPSSRTDRTWSVSDSVIKMWGRHNLRFGGDLRDVRLDSRTDATSRGAFVFTGLYTGGGTRVGGFDVADFLLGLAQQASVQYGPGVERFRARSWSLYAQDDWRVKSNVTLNAGLRYEYQSPYWEANNRLANLDATQDFSAVAAVQAGQVGPFTGAFPATLVNPDRNNLAPRIGAAWRPNQKTMVRGGYGINYASVPYLSFAQRLASQPPFAVSDTRAGTIARPLAVTDAFSAAPTATTTNNFGVDKNYQLGYVQIWNADVQRDLSRTLSVGASYIGTKGSQLDLLRAPNRGPSGLLLADVQPFVWESSGGHSIMHSLSVRMNRRLSQGIAGGVTYTLSQSKDNASSLGGAAGQVAQNDRDLDAEWGLSSFNQRHRLSAAVTWELPFGANRRWLSGTGWTQQVFGGWIWSANLALSSGTPYTARVIGDVTDVSRGTNGTLRANYDGEPIALANPTIAEFFNTAAFSIPAAGTFGTAGRNTITGPGSANLNMALQKTFSLAGTRGLSLRAQASNVLNRAQWAAIDTVVNSPTFGQVTSVRPMRSVQVIVRVMF